MSSLFFKSYICIHQVHSAQSTGGRTGRAAGAHPDVLPDRGERRASKAPVRGGGNPECLRHAVTIIEP